MHNSIRYSEKAPDAVWPFGKNGCHRMPGELLSSPEWLEKASRTSSHLLDGHNEERPIIHTTTSAWKMPPSWHWTGHSGGNWQQAELYTEIVQAEQWWWCWWW